VFVNIYEKRAGALAPARFSFEAIRLVKGLVAVAIQSLTVKYLLTNNLTTSQSNKQFRTTIGHLPDSIGRTPDVTHFYFVYNYSCNKEPGSTRTENSTPALVRNRARMLTISSPIFLREMWFGIPSLLRIFYAGHVPALY
jgi:hypothetical protein